MDHNRFDDLTRTIAGTSTRRRFSGKLAALGLGSLATLRLVGGEADAKKRGNKRGKGKKKVTVCHNGQTTRVSKRALKKHLGHGDTRGACPCDGRECGPDGLGGSCGTCQLPFICATDGSGQCVPLIIPIP